MWTHKATDPVASRDTYARLPGTASPRSPPSPSFPPSPLRCATMSNDTFSDLKAAYDEQGFVVVPTAVLLPTDSELFARLLTAAQRHRLN